MSQGNLNIYLILDTDLILQDKYIFDLVYLEQEEGWRLKRTTITIYTNFFSTQQEYIGIISPSKKIIATI